MTLSEIETILGELALRHPNLNVELLTTLLLSAGWEEKNIREAILLFKDKRLYLGTDKKRFSPSMQGVVAPTTPTISLEAQVPLVETVAPPVIPTPPLPAPLQQEPESLIVHEEEKVPTIPREKVQSNIPDNLPLRAFENSPHVWEFSRYKDTFHGEVMPNEEEVKKAPLVKEKQIDFAPTLPEKPYKITVEEIDGVIEKTPLTKSDKSIVFLAGAMLLAILVILQYMYSNGRL